MCELHRHVALYPYFVPALEGADLTLTYLKSEAEDAKDVEELLHNRAPKCKFQMLEYDLTPESACHDLVKKHLDFHHSKQIDVLSVQFPHLRLHFHLPHTAYAITEPKTRLPI